MSSKTLLGLLFSSILLSLLVFTAWASTQQSIFQWGGLTTGPDRYWTIATLMDAYFGFVTFYVWVLYKEPHWLPRREIDPLLGLLTQGASPARSRDGGTK
jgi:hypothetical protein